MKKKLIAILITGIAAISMAACQSSSSSDNKVDDSNFRVAKEIPKSFDDYGETKSADYYKKATGFDYDRNKLDYKLVWSDEFDYEGKPDSTKWKYDVGADGWGNNELQEYTDDNNNAWVKDGKLTIELRKEKNKYGEIGYTSARIKTRDLADWRYGKFEISAKLPRGKGTWPAIWMLPTDTTEYGAWPTSGEIDIMEHVGYLQNIINHNVHTKAFNGMDGTNKGFAYAYKGVSDDFHTYTLEWLPDKLIFSIDGEEKFTYDPHEYVENVTSEEWPFDKEFHLIINLAYGGNWAGRTGVDDSVLPQQLQVDYVRVYQSDVITALGNKKDK